MLRCSLWCLLTALPGCSAGSSLVPCLRGRLELMSLCIGALYKIIDPGDQCSDRLIGIQVQQRGSF